MWKFPKGEKYSESRDLKKIFPENFIDFKTGSFIKDIFSPKRCNI
jgi:hypothetical protein